MELSNELLTLRHRFEEKLKGTQSILYPNDDRFHQACRYALDGKGKRIRPLLVYLSYQAAGGVALDQVDSSAVAIEMIHTYSLVHDDLPCMDNDDWRRGRLTTHRQFDEATALLVGDALLSDAFRIVSENAMAADPSVLLPVIQDLSQAIGGRGMILGQSLDLFWTGRQGYRQEDLDQIHDLKTACLIQASCAIGARIAGAKPEQLQALQEFGSHLGLAFQIIDDLIDDRPGTGKTKGKDRTQNKLTYLELMDTAQAESIAEKRTAQAYQCLESFGPRANGLRELAEHLLNRNI